MQCVRNDLRARLRTELRAYETGALAGKADVVAAVRSMHNVLGGTIDPHAAYLLLRGMKTLDVRVQRQNTVRTAQPPSLHCAKNVPFLLL